MKFSIFIVEGAHDCSALGCILKHNGFHGVYRKDHLPPELANTVPSIYPFDGGTHLDRVAPVPEFWNNSEQWACIYNAGGFSRLSDKLREILLTMRISMLEKIKKITILCDADECFAEKRRDQLIGQIIAQGKQDEMYEIDHNRLHVKDGDRLIDFSLYIFPNNKDQGSLETLMLEEAGLIYSDLLCPAQKYINDIPLSYIKGLNPREKDKALVGIISNIFRPGKANQVAISDEYWFRASSKEEIISHKALTEFICDVINE